MLWIRSTGVLGPAQVGDAWEALVWLASPSGWWDVVKALGRDTREHPLTVALAAAVFAALAVFRPRLRHALEEIAPLVTPSRTDRFTHTLKALVLTALLAVPWPGLALFVAWRLWRCIDMPPFVDAVSAGLHTTAVFYLLIEFARQTIRPAGLAEAHFRWRNRTLRPLRKSLVWLTAIGMPLVFVASSMEWHAHEAWHDSLGRLAFVAGLVVLAGFVQHIMRPSGDLLKDAIGRSRGGWLDRLRYVWYPLAVLAPVALAVVATLGYYYTALELEQRLRYTIMLTVGLAIVDALVMRGLFVIRRRLAMRKADARVADAGDSAADADTAPGPVEEQGPNLFTMSTQTRKLLQGTMAFALVIGLWFIWVDVLPALGILDRMELWHVGEPPAAISVADLVLAAVIVMMTVIAARNIPGVLEMMVLQRLPLEYGIRYAITALSRYLIMTVGIIVAFGAVGVGWSTVQWLVAAVSVGLGFGLQEIFANFVSGLILLFERPIRVGDTVTVGDITGTVSRIRTRATTITDWDRKELIVPNKEFITGKLVNWTLSDSIIRLRVPVGIEYGSDTALAHTLLLEVAGQQPDVLDDPAPAALFLGFGANSLDFDLRVYISGMDSFLKVRHDLHMAIDQAFRKAHIVIAFPQQDVHIRSVDRPMPFVQTHEDS